MASRNATMVFLAVFATVTLLNSCEARSLQGVDLRSSSCPTNIKKGQKGACVSSLQELLNKHGASPKLDVDGDFGRNTHTATRNFQSRKGLKVDGICGPNTKNALYASRPTTPTGKGAAICSAARAEIGVPYVWGGGHKARPGKSTGTCVGYTGSIRPCPAERTVGYDCSGLTRWAIFKAFGHDGNNGATGTQVGALLSVDRLNILCCCIHDLQPFAQIALPLVDSTVAVSSSPETCPMQEAKLKKASKRTYKPVVGDIIFWKGHTAVYCGNNRMIEAQKTGTNVHEVRLRSGGRYYRF